jgi:signal transduction histidine kinase
LETCHARLRLRFNGRKLVRHGAPNETDGGVTGSAEGRRRAAHWGRPGLALIAASVLLPIVLYALAAWYSYDETIRRAEQRVERTTRILEEHALKVFESQRLVIEQVNLRLRFMDWSKEADRVDLYNILVKLQDDLDQVSTITVADAQGRMLASGRTYPANPAISFADRDYFQTLQKGASALPTISNAYLGRQTKIPVFNVAGRIGSGGDFKGVIAVSADVSYFQDFYKSVDPDTDHRVLLVRTDGAILVSEPKLPFEHLPPTSKLLRDIQTQTSGSYSLHSQLDGVDRIFSFRRIGAYPVVVRFGIARSAALASWYSMLVIYGIAALLASLALLLASSFAVRQTQRERVARRKWEETAAALQAEAAERERIEGQLRQSQKMEAVGRLTGGLAHDFNNLLTAVIGSLDLVRRRPGGMEPRNLQFIGNALEGANRAAALTSRLLAFSRQQALEPVATDANALIESMLTLLGSTLGERVRIETHLATDLRPTLVDPNQLESAIVNLAVNARDAMPEGGLIRIETANVEIADGDPDVGPGAWVLVAVSDTGTGMPPEVVAQIFEPFFTTKPVGKGTGLGLSQVYGFIKQSGGNVAVTSALGGGSTFKLYLPRAAAMEAAQSEEPWIDDAAALPMSRAGETILVVEDEEMVRQLGVAALEEAGYRVLAACDATQALALLRANADIALLFSDIVLTGPMDGRQLADVVLAERPGLPVLFTTGYSRNAIVHDGRLDEGVELINKPYTGIAVVARVKALLSQRRPRRLRLVRSTAS